MTDDPLRMWAVYDHPSDYPDKFVARLHEVDGNGSRPTASIIIADDLDRLRDMLAFEMHLVCLARAPSRRSGHSRDMAMRRALFIAASLLMIAVDLFLLLGGDRSCSSETPKPAATRGRPRSSGTTTT